MSTCRCGVATIKTRGSDGRRRSPTGRASWDTENAGFQVMADNLQREKTTEIRERRGMNLELPESIDYI